jgi:malate dehydrogenase (oxaloacetate-decarboxylating)
MGIPIGKLCLYTACAGIHPKGTLPIFLDTGTDNEERLNDPLYIGWRHERLRGQEYDDFIDEFVQCVKKRFPNVLLQWEDFAQRNAGPILDRYRDQLCSFNDDIQGTAAVAVGTLFAAIKVAKSDLRQQRIAIVGAGSAGCGISNLILQAMMEEGLTEEDAKSRFFLIDRTGLLTDATTGLFPFQKPFAQAKQQLAHWELELADKISFKDVIHNVHPTLLIGVCGQSGIFTEEIVREMAAHTPRPIIFPLSNPTNRSEAIPSDLIKWTQGTVIMGTGSPFGFIQKDGKPFRVDQTNNSYIFPGMGLGLIATKAKRVTDAMFMAAAKALAECSPSTIDPTANLLPPLSSIREVSYKVAIAVAKEAVHAELTDCSLEEIEARIRSNMWTPAYPTYLKKKFQTLEQSTSK